MLEYKINMGKELKIRTCVGGDEEGYRNYKK